MVESADMARTRRQAGGLWPHQRLAVETAGNYLTAEGVGEASALITMPTGTGKTGVIATVTTAIPEVQGHRLVLTPWTALANQLIVDLGGRFWERIPVEQRPEPLPVRRLPPSSLLTTLGDNEPTVWVATTAAISVATTKADGGAFDMAEVFSGFGVVMVDEGHYEPAPEWSEAIRAINQRTILLTATPYRNDEKFFNIAADRWRYRFPHWQAEEERFLRRPEFVTLRSANTPEAFARQLLESVTERFPDQRPRVIVRCETANSIRLIVHAIEQLGESAVGVHEIFPLGDGVLRRRVPMPADCPARFWVHQNKLIEGIDDPEFKVLGFYEALTNDRAIIQQIGRVLRNPARRRNDMTALVVIRGDRDIERTWNAYRAFDRQDDAESVATLPDLVGRVLEAQPVAFYYDRAYRTRIELDSPTAWREFAYPLRTRVFRLRAGHAPTIDDLEREISRQWARADRTVYRTQEPDSRTRILPFVTAENSRLLRSGTFIEPELGYTLMRLDDDLLFFFDSRGSTPDAIDEHFAPLRPPDLQPLFPQGHSSLTSVSLLNTDIGRQAPRSRHIRAAAIADLAPDLADYAYVCTIAEGYTEVAGEPRFRRYVGLSRSRVNDYRRGERDYPTYSDWLDALKGELSSDIDSAITFTRYATFLDEPDSTDPVHVLFDIDPNEFAQAITGDPLDFDDRATGVTNGAFVISVNETAHEGTLAWDTERARYDVSIPTLQDELFVSQDGETRELVSSINADQALRIVPEARTTIYAHGSFFRPVIPATRAGAFRLLDILYSVESLETAATEKGRAIVNDDWEDGSVFALLSALAPENHRAAPESMQSLFPDPNLVLCTDLGTEVADFVVTGDRRVAFIHAKASRTTRLTSASALHDVASQAIKNLHHLQPLTDTRMATNGWTGNWSASHVAGATRRLRHGDFTTGPAMWRHIRSVIAVPDSEREVWLVVGNALSKSALQQQAERRPPAHPTAEALQIYSLLQATWGAVSQLGARLRVFCSP
jgi:superfamily II DNA or RNA helicase